MSGTRVTSRSLRDDFLAGVLLELSAWLDSEEPDREHLHRVLHRWVGTGGTIGLRGLHEEARALRALVLAGEPWGKLRLRCESLLRVTRELMADSALQAALVDGHGPEVALRLADPELRVRVTLELAGLRPAPRIVEQTISPDGLVLWDGAGTAELEEYLDRHAAMPVGGRPRVLVLCEPGVVPGWIARRAGLDVQFLVGASDRAHLRETLLSMLQGGRPA